MFRGKHGLLDISGFICNCEEGCNTLFNIAKSSTKLGSCRIVGENRVIYDGSLSPKGFSFALILDESHICAHCYSDLGLLSIDIFTCGSSNPFVMMEYIHSQLLLNYPNIQTTKLYKLNRFAYTDKNDCKFYEDANLTDVLQIEYNTFSSSAISTPTTLSSDMLDTNLNPETPDLMT